MSQSPSLETSLTSFGLTSTEASLYIAGLGQHPCTIQTLAKETHIKRPTIYHALGTLLEKGLVQERKHGSKTEYVMAHPEHIHSLVEVRRATLDAQAKQLDSLIPLLIHKQSDAEINLEVIHQHGAEGVKMVMNVAFRAKSKHWDIIAPYQNFLREFDAAYAEQYLRTRKIRGITARTLWEIKPGGRRLTAEEQAERNPRLMPKALQGKFSSMLFMFDDKVAIFSPHKNQSAILITSSDIHAMFSSMFNGLWEQSEPY